MTLVVAVNTGVAASLASRTNLAASLLQGLRIILDQQIRPRIRIDPLHQLHGCWLVARRYVYSRR